MSKYKIGIPGWKIGDNSFGITVPYIDYITEIGEPIILTPESEIREDLDLLILPGGPDVDPSRYGEKPGYYTSRPCIHREYFDINHLPEYIKLSIPILGICRGIQTLSVHFDYKLKQHIKCHPTNGDYDRWKACHDVNILNPYYQIINRNLKGIKMNFKTNSMHHQAVDRDSKRDSNFRIVGLAPDGNVEIMAHDSLPIVGIQYHPEEMEDLFVTKTVEFLLENKKSILK